MERTRLRRKDKSTVSKTEYLMYHIIFGAIFGFDIYFILPCIIPVAIYYNSIWKLFVCLLSTSLYGILVSFHYNRSDMGVFLDVISGLGLYIILILGQYTPNFTKLLFSGTAVISAIGTICIFLRKMRKKNNVKQILISRFLKSAQLIQKNVSIAAGIALVVLPIGLSCFHNDRLSDDYYQKVYGENEDQDVSVSKAYGDEYRLSENIDTIKLIRDNDMFQSLDYNKKCEVLEAIIYCEARYLGLCELKVEFSDTENDTTLGTYNHATKTITVNAKPIRDGSLPGGTAEELLITVIHECRHCYQHLLAEMYIAVSPEQRNLYAFAVEGVDEWVKNLDNYKSGDGGLDEQREYFMQSVEEDARSYSRQEAMIYYDEIDRYLGETYGSENVVWSDES